MATNKDVNIKITTKADSKALDAVNKKLVNLGKSTAKTSKATTKALTDEEKMAKKHAAATKKRASAKKKADDAAKKALERLRKEKDKAEIAAHKHEDALKREAAAQRKLTNAANKTTAATSKSTKATGKAKKANIDLGRSTLLASQGYEDLQFGISGVLNNIPPLVMSLGGSAGLAGVISITTVVAAQLAGSFNTTKKVTGELGTALDSLVDVSLRKLNEELSDEEDHDSFQRGVRGDIDAIDDFVVAIDTAAEKREQLRRIEQDSRKKEIELEMLQIESSGLSKSAEQKAKSPLRQELGLMAGKSKAESIRDEVEDLEEKSRFLKRDQAVKTGKLSALEGSLVSKSEVDRAKSDSENIEKIRERSVQQLLDNPLPKFIPRGLPFGEKVGDMATNMFSSSSRDKETVSRSDKSEAAFNKAHKKLVEASELPSESDQEQQIKAQEERIALDEIVKAVDFAKAAIPKGATVSSLEKRILEAGEIVRVSLLALDQEVSKALKSEELKKKRGEQLESRDELKSALDDLDESIPNIAKSISKLRLDLDSAKFNTAIDEQIIEIRNAEAQKSAKEADNKKRKDEEKARAADQGKRDALAAAEAKSARSQSVAGAGITRGLGKLTGSAGGTNPKIQSFISGAGDGQTGAEAQALKDYLIGRQTELTRNRGASTATMKILADLITVSQKQADEARAMEIVLKKMRAEVAALNKNAKRSQK